MRCHGDPCSCAGAKSSLRPYREMYSDPHQKEISGGEAAAREAFLTLATSGLRVGERLKKEFKEREPRVASDLELAITRL